MTRHSEQEDPRLTVEVIREFISAGVCWLCSAGPFRSLAQHTNKAHGIDRHEIRSLARLSSHDSVASAELSERMRELAFERGLGDIGREAVRAGQTPRGARHTQESRALIAEKTRARMSSLPESERRDLGKKLSQAVTPEGRRRQAERMRELHASGVYSHLAPGFVERMQTAEVKAKRASARRTG